jgi:hypothetical protein
MRYRIAGRSQIAFGAATLLVSLAAAFVLDALTLDLAAFVVIGLGARVCGHSGRAARWSVVLMTCYALIAVALMVAGNLDPQRIQLAGRTITPDALPWALAASGAIAAWSVANIALLLAALRSPREAV